MHNFCTRYMIYNCWHDGSGTMALLWPPSGLLVKQLGLKSRLLKPKETMALSVKEHGFLSSNIKLFLASNEMGNWLKQTFPLMNLWLNNWVFLDEKKILKKFQSSSSKLLPKLKPTPVCLKFCCCCNCSPVCSRESTHLPALSWYCSWTTPLQWRGKGKPMLWTHGNGGTWLPTAHLCSCHGQEGSKEQQGTSFLET